MTDASNSTYRMKEYIEYFHERIDEVNVEVHARPIIVIIY